MASSYGWIITKDNVTNGIEGLKTRVGMLGPRDLSEEMSDRLKNGEGAKFRMKDDDGNIYYYGRLVGDEDSEDGFGPLDDLGRPDAGATSIEYYKNGKWEVL